MLSLSGSPGVSFESGGINEYYLAIIKEKACKGERESDREKENSDISMAIEKSGFMTFEKWLCIRLCMTLCGVLPIYVRSTHNNYMSTIVYVSSSLLVTVGLS